MCGGMGGMLGGWVRPGLGRLRRNIPNSHRTASKTSSGIIMVAELVFIE